MITLLYKQLKMLATAILVLGLCSLGAGPVQSAENIPKQVHLVVDGERLIASNVRFSRFDELRLSARERLLDTEEGDAVIVAVTSQRIIAYGVVSGWRSVDRIASERIESITAEDFAGLVVTSQRFLNFNGESGVWGERARRVGR